MAQYQKIEYLIGKDGKVTERVIEATGSSCTDTTAPLEQELGQVESQTLLPEYYQEEDSMITSETQYLNQS